MKNRPWQTSFCQGRIKTIIRGTTLIHSSRHALYGHEKCPWQLTYALRCRILSKKPLTAPSAVHLPTCFLPDSHHRGLSVKSWSALSPHQRFDYHKYSTHKTVCQEKKQKILTLSLKPKKTRTAKMPIRCMLLVARSKNSCFIIRRKRFRSIK